jgi:hypothetical protein
MEATIHNDVARVPWNKGKLTGQKPPLKLREIWAIRIRLQLGGKTRDLAMFNLAIDSKLRACDLTKLRVRGICLGSRVAPRAIVMQQKTNDQSSSKSLSRPGKPWKPGSKQRGSRLRTFCFGAASMHPRTYRRVSTRGSSIAGCDRLDLTTRRTARTRCAEQRHH